LATGAQALVNQYRPCFRVPDKGTIVATFNAILFGTLDAERYQVAAEFLIPKDFDSRFGSATLTFFEQGAYFHT
jgi:hypothetical protein